MPRKRLAPRWSLYPDLHDQVSGILIEDDLFFDFHNSDNEHTSLKEYDTNIMGSFACPNQICESAGWSSKKIAVTIRMYSGASYNARVYHQRCRSCKSLSRPELDESYAERIAYRIKKWCHVNVKIPPFSRKESKGPHQSHLCEGCQNGHCTEMRLERL